MDNKAFVITRLKLVNFAHFSEIGLSELEIDRKKSKNDIILVIGGNGSGKSLLASAWTPRVNDATNNRKKPLIVKDSEGIKEVDISEINPDGDFSNIIYKCRIIYGKSTNCSIIKKDSITGEEIELNPNGLVSSYDNVLDEIFGITKYYANIGYLSPQITSLVSMKPGPRYEYLTVYLPDISEYMENYKTVMKRVNIFNRQLKMLESDIGDATIGNITKNKKSLLVKIDSISKELDSIKEYRIKMTTLRDQLANVDKVFLMDNINAINNNKIKLDKYYIELNKLYESSKKYIGKNGDIKLSNDISKIESDIKITNDKLSKISNDIDINNIKLKDLESNLGILDTSESLPDVTSMIHRIESDIIDLLKTIQEYENKIPFLKEVTELDSTKFNIMYNLINTIYDKSRLITDLIDINKLPDMNTIGDLNDSKNKIINDKLSMIDKKISYVSEKIILLKNSPLDDNILDFAPKDCNSSTCGLIKEINKLLNPSDEILKLESELESLYSDKTKLSDELNVLADDKNKMVVVLNHVNDINHALMRDKEYINYFPTHIKDILSSSIDVILSNINIVINNMDKIGEYIEIKNQYNTYKKELNNLKDKEITIKLSNSMNNNYIELNNDLESMKSEQDSLIEYSKLLIKRYDELIDIKSSSSVINDKIEEYNKLANENISQRNKIIKICKDWYYRNLITHKMNKSDIEIQKITVRLESLKSELESINNTIATKQSLINMRDKFINIRSKLELLLSAWNPKTGIPSLFINNFLARIHYRSNIYLESLNGKNLLIDKFEIGKNAREFPIIMKKDDGTIIDDASMTSEGQQALITLAISMAMINEAIKPGGYSVIRLDEMDAMLDDTRRKLYTIMIKEKLKEINSRQAMIISHNDSFDDLECDIILFPGANKNVESLKNKNVLLDVSNIEINSF